MRVTSTGEILWPVKAFFAVAFPNSQRQYLGIVDKSKSALATLFCRIFGGDVAAPMVVSYFLNLGVNFCLNVSQGSFTNSISVGSQEVASKPFVPPFYRQLARGVWETTQPFATVLQPTDPKQLA